MPFPTDAANASVTVQPVVRNHVCATGATVNVTCTTAAGVSACRTYSVQPVGRRLPSAVNMLCWFVAVALQWSWAYGRLPTALLAPVSVGADLLNAVAASVAWAHGSTMGFFSPAAMIVAVWGLVSHFVLATTCEEVFAVRGVGLQLSSRDGLRRQSVCKVIDVNTIDAVVIHEGYFRHQVVYYLCVVVKDSPDVVVLFEDTLPRLAALRHILRGIRHVLYNEREFGPSMADADRVVT